MCNENEHVKKKTTKQNEIINISLIKVKETNLLKYNRKLFLTKPIIKIVTLKHLSPKIIKIKSIMIISIYMKISYHSVITLFEPVVILREF